MNTCILELNDAGITAVVNGRVLIESPGIAVAEDARVLVGDDAYHSARLSPTHMFDRFWDELSQAPLPNATKRIRSNADLAYLHLQQIWSRVGQDCDSVLVATPGTVQKDQLGLFLGIARECGVPVEGLVDLAVCAADRTAAGRLLLHLDMQRHRTVLTRLDQGDMLRRSDVEIIVNAGTAELCEAWVAAVADTFVRATRFDPMHIAETEQMLFDRLPDWIERLHQDIELPVSLERGERVFEVTLQRQKLLQATAAVYEQIVGAVKERLEEDRPTTLIVSRRVDKLPGLSELLRQLPDLALTVRDEKAVAANAIHHVDVIRTSMESPQLVTGLPSAGTNDDVETAADTRPPTPPTHIVHRGRALLLGSGTFEVGAQIPGDAKGLEVDGAVPGVSRRHFTIVSGEQEVYIEDHSTYGTFLNGRKIEDRSRLKPGDRIRVGSPGVELELVTVENGHGKT